MVCVQLVWSASLLMLGSILIHADRCTDNLNRCARVRDQTGFSYEIGDTPVNQWVANLVLIDPESTSTVCRDWGAYVDTMSCIRARLTEYDCWSNSKYYYSDRYVPDERTLKASMEVFCNPSQRQKQVNLVNCMYINAKEKKKKDDCLVEEEAKSVRNYGTAINDRSMCSFFHRRINCYRIYFGAICQNLAQNTNNQFMQISSGPTMTMDEYFDPLAKSSLCNLIDGAVSINAGLLVTIVCLVLQFLI